MQYSEKKTLLISGLDVQEIVLHVGVSALMDRLIGDLQSRILSIDSRVRIPIRAGFNYEHPSPGLIEWMPIYKEGENVLLKVVGYHPLNSHSFDLPTIIATIYAYDTKTGQLSTIIDGGLLTALRTGAASALASKLLAHPASTTLGLIGCGAQAVTQLHAISRKFDIKEVLLNDIDEDTVSSFEKRCSVFGLNARFEIAEVREIAEKSDILCTATSLEIGAGPLFSGISTKHHLHINAVGSDFPGKIEIPLSFLKDSFVCPDFFEQALLEGECQQLSAEGIGADLTEVVKNPDKFKKIRNERSVFDSTGWALEDQVAMELLLEHALELGLGQEVAIENILRDSKNPYDFIRNQVTPVDVDIHEIANAI